MYIYLYTVLCICPSQILKLSENRRFCLAWISIPCEDKLMLLLYPIQLIVQRGWLILIPNENKLMLLHDSKYC